MKSNYTEYLTKTGAFIKDNKKSILWVGGSLLVVIIGIVVVKKVQSGVGNLFTDKATRATPFKNIEFDDSKTTISDAIANAYANQLYNAMKSSGTDEDTIYNVLQKLQKKEDFLKVYNAYGRKSYTGAFIGQSPTKLDSWLGNYDDLDLVEWLQQEVGYLNYPTYSLIKKTVTNAGLAF